MKHIVKQWNQLLRAMMESVIQTAVKGAILTSVLWGPAMAKAQVPVNQIQLGVPSYMGTGCPLGTVSATLSPDAQSLSIMFGSFQAIAGGSSGLTVDRKACNIAIPVRVPQGYSVSVMKIDYRGYRRLPMYGSATFDVEYYFAGQNGPAYHKNFTGAEDGNFTLNNQLVATSQVWSDCGADVNLRTNTSIAVQTNSFNEQAQMTLDSADITSGVVYQLSWRSCGMNGGGNSGGGGYPNPYPTPVPGGNYPGMGPCVINSYYDNRGFQLFMVKDGMGRVVGNTVQYAEALRLAQQSQSMGFCSGVINSSQPGNPQQPYPNPYPNPYPQPQNGCQIMPGRDAYGRQFFRIVDRAGRMVMNTPNYQVAQHVTQTDPRCR